MMKTFVYNFPKSLIIFKTQCVGKYDLSQSEVPV